MKISVKKEAGHYLLSICYSVSASLAESWDLLATDSGFARWFLKWKTSVKTWIYWNIEKIRKLPTGGIQQQFHLYCLS
ncbi:hypothetical protein [Streptococcus suis]|uniref:hypothetical protein n=1 Tax=Streptococcus suis TaxID=1307 RepID=UPI0021BBD01E|nr:hypothetical protein [Streptococcus suis]